MSIIKCRFCGKPDKNYGGFCQKCYTYFVVQGYEVFNKPAYGEIKFVENKRSPQYAMPICHICGKAFAKLGQHAYYSHGLTKKEYCDKFGIDRKCRLTNEDYHFKMKMLAYKYNMDEQVKEVGKQTRFQKGHDNNYVRSCMTQNRLKNSKFVK